MSVVAYAVADRVARITLNRPERGNGINRALIAEPFGDHGGSTFKG
jgi:enoyl-CoA hydratase/carnithine racemase